MPASGPAPGYPACPDHSLKPTLFEMLGGEPAGVTLTESFAMLPASAVSGFYFGHRDSQYFGVARIGRDQLEDYAARRGVPARGSRALAAAESGLTLSREFCYLESRKGTAMANFASYKLALLATVAIVAPSAATAQDSEQRVHVIGAMQEPEPQRVYVIGAMQEPEPQRVYRDRRDAGAGAAAVT